MIFWESGRWPGDMGKDISKFTENNFQRQGNRRRWEIGYRTNSLSLISHLPLCYGASKNKFALLKKTMLSVLLKI
jgi:hypothetical protein